MFALWIVQIGIILQSRGWYCLSRDAMCQYMFIGLEYDIIVEMNPGLSQDPFCII